MCCAPRHMMLEAGRDSGSGIVNPLPEFFFFPLPLLKKKKKNWKKSNFPSLFTCQSSQSRHPLSNHSLQVIRWHAISVGMEKKNFFLVSWWRHRNRTWPTCAFYHDDFDPGVKQSEVYSLYCKLTIEKKVVVCWLVTRVKFYHPPFRH